MRVYNGAMISKFSAIGDFVWIFNQTMLANDPHPPSDGVTKGPVIEEYAVLASMCVVLPGVRVGAGSVVAAHSVVSKDVEPGALVSGVPAQRRGNASDIPLRDGSGRPAYPWNRHYHRGYPPEVVEEWKARFRGEAGAGRGGP